MFKSFQGHVSIRKSRLLHNSGLSFHFRPVSRPKPERMHSYDEKEPESEDKFGLLTVRFKKGLKVKSWSVLRSGCPKLYK